MYIYDFDETIYDGDSSKDFFLYCFKLYPNIIMRIIPRFLFSCVLYKLKRIKKEQLKSVFFSFIRYIEDIQSIVDRFWEINYKKIKSWYLYNEHSQDVIISASPSFLLEYPCEKLGVKKLIATEVDIETGEIIGMNCHGEEKVIRFKKEFGDIGVDEAYSDSMSDIWIFRLANTSYLVSGNSINKVI